MNSEQSSKRQLIQLSQKMKDSHRTVSERCMKAPP